MSDVSAGQRETAPSTQRKAPRWMWAVLVVSVSLNLLVAGIVIGAGFARPSSGGSSAGLMGFSLVRYAVTRANDRDEARRFLAAERPRIDPLRKELRAARQSVAEAMLSDPFEAARLRAAQSRVIELERRLGEASLDTLVALAGKLTAAERKDFVSQRGRRWHRNRPPEADIDPVQPARQ